MAINIPETFICEAENREWTGTIQVKEAGEHFCLVSISSRDTEFLAAFSCYFDGYGIKEWCLCVPNLNFGCKLSSVFQSWNEEQFSKYISNPVDRKSLATAATVILQELNREPVREIQESKEQIAEEREAAFIDGIELKLDMSEPISDEDYVTYKEYINNRTSREAEQKQEEVPLERPKKEAERKSRMTGKAR